MLGSSALGRLYRAVALNARLAELLHFALKPMINFTLQDIGGAARAIVAFSAILFSPGYVLGSTLNLFRFRGLSLRERAAWSVALSFASVPIFTTLAGRWAGIRSIVIVLVLLVAASILLILQHRGGSRGLRDRYFWALVAFLVLASGLVVGELVDIQVGHRLYLSVTVLDQGYRVAFTNAIARTGLPPANPFYHPGQSAPLRYYYFWYAVCAVCMELAHVSARQALMASSVWSGLGLCAVIALFVRHFLQVRGQVHRHVLTAILLLTVTGADLIPVFYNILVRHDFGGEMEWWSADQVASWLDTILWVPNHTAALIVCLVAFLLFWRTKEQTWNSQKRCAVLLAGVAVASAFGLSIYVTAGFLLMFAAWSLWLRSQHRRSQVVAPVASAAAVSGLLLGPYLHDLLRSSSGTEGRGAARPAHLLQFSIRRMIDPSVITGLPRLRGFKAHHPLLLDQASRLLLLLPGYALELGFFGVVLVFAWIDRKRLDESRRTALFFSLTGLAIVSVIRSSVIGNNDFGYRAVLLPCFFLLLLGAETLLDVQDGHAPVRKLRGVLLTLPLLLGLCGTAFQAQALRTYVPMHAIHGAAGYEGLAEGVFQLKQAYVAMNQILPPNAIVQSNPSEQASYFYVANTLFAERPMVTDAAPDCGAVFGGDPALCPSTQESIRALFNAPGATAGDARKVCGRTGAQYLVASRRDQAWRQHDSWVWTLPQVALPEWSAAAGVRTVNCAEAPEKVPRD